MENKSKNIPLFKVFMPPEVDDMIIKTLHSGYLAEGERVKEFRQKIREFLGTEFVVPMSSCTMALQISYRLAGVGPGDEVISVPLTSICTNAPIVSLGAKIVWADCEPSTGMTDPAQLESLITKKTKAIVVLHKDGDLAKMDEILAIAKKHKIKVIEDAAHALGATYKGRKVGTIGDYTCFSLQAIKQITTGDGGFLTCKTEEDFALAKKLKWLGLDKESLPPGGNTWANDISVVGYKGNMNDIAATIGLATWPHVEEIISKCNRNGELYNQLLAGMPGVTVLDRQKDCFSVYWTYIALFKNRDKVMKALNAAGVSAMHVHPRNDVYSIFKESKRVLPGVDYFDKHELSLPVGWWVLEEDIRMIVDVIKKNI